MNNFSEDDRWLENSPDLDYLAELIRLLPDLPNEVIDALQIPLPWGWAPSETNEPEGLTNTLTLKALEKGFNDETPY